MPVVVPESKAPSAVIRQYVISTHSIKWLPSKSSGRCLHGEAIMHHTPAERGGYPLLVRGIEEDVLMQEVARASSENLSFEGQITRDGGVRVLFEGEASDNVRYTVAITFLCK